MVSPVPPSLVARPVVVTSQKDASTIGGISEKPPTSPPAGTAEATAPVAKLRRMVAASASPAKPPTNPDGNPVTETLPRARLSTIEPPTARPVWPPTPTKPSTLTATLPRASV